MRVVNVLSIIVVVMVIVVVVMVCGRSGGEFCFASNISILFDFPKCKAANILKSVSCIKLFVAVMVLLAVLLVVWM